MSSKSVIATSQLENVINKWPQQERDYLLHIVAARAEYFKQVYRDSGPIAFVKAFYDAFDELLAEKVKDVSCKRGCHFCCRQNVDISKAEAKVIAEFCQEHQIEIPRKYLEEQLKYGIKEVARTEVGWCVFLKKGECSIYSVRPLACRKYYVCSPAEQCDVIKYPPPQNTVAVVVFTEPELEACSFYAAVDQHGAGRMPQMLLPYSK